MEPSTAGHPPREALSLEERIDRALTNLTAFTGRVTAG
jgi:hypothetical protein